MGKYILTVITLSTSISLNAFALDINAIIKSCIAGTNPGECLLAQSSNLIIRSNIEKEFLKFQVQGQDGSFEAQEGQLDQMEDSIMPANAVKSCPGYQPGKTDTKQLNALECAIKVYGNHIIQMQTKAIPVPGTKYFVGPVLNATAPTFAYNCPDPANPKYRLMIHAGKIVGQIMSGPGNFIYANGPKTIGSSTSYYLGSINDGADGTITVDSAMSTQLVLQGSMDWESPDGKTPGKMPCFGNAGLSYNLPVSTQAPASTSHFGAE